MSLSILSWEKKYTQGVNALAARALDEAIDSLKAAVDIAGRLGEEEPLMHSFLSLGDALKFSGDFPAAKKSYSEVISRAGNKSDLREVSIIARGCLGMLYMAEGEPVKARLELEKAVDLIRRQRHLRSPEFAPIILGLAGVYLELDEFECADKICNYAYEYSNEVLGAESTCTLAAMNLRALCAEFLGQPKRAKERRAQMNERTEHYDENGTDESGLRNAFSEKPLLPDRDKKANAKPKLTKGKSNVLQFPKRKSDSHVVVDQSSQQKAEEIVMRAWELPKKEHAKLAKAAIKISPDCVNAYLLLADTLKNTEARIPILRKAIAAANRTLGPDWQEKYEGHCWQCIETRPALRAMAMLATCLKWADELAEALEIFRTLMKLTQSDNQGIRYLLAPCLYEAGLDAELEKLLKAFSDDRAAALLYTKALYLFRKEGASKHANSALLKAFEANPFVPLFLSDIVETPDNNTRSMGVGDDTEAAEYLDDSGYLWGDTDGACLWMATQLERPMRNRFTDQNMIDEVLIELKLE
jgi:tetratricopeptide (TPR) repeat protein